jgi:hypothetical protein
MSKGIAAALQELCIRRDKEEKPKDSQKATQT